MRWRFRESEVHPEQGEALQRQPAGHRHRHQGPLHLGLDRRACLLHHLPNTSPEEAEEQSLSKVHSLAADQSTILADLPWLRAAMSTRRSTRTRAGAKTRGSCATGTRRTRSGNRCAGQPFRSSGCVPPIPLIIINDHQPPTETQSKWHDRRAALPHPDGLFRSRSGALAALIPAVKAA